MKLRSGLWAIGAPFRAALIGAIKLYRATLSSSLGGQCRFFPSCSAYAEEAIRTHGAVKGSAFAIWRIVRCGPFTSGGVDQVPASRKHAEYDTVMHAGVES